MAEAISLQKSVRYLRIVVTTSCPMRCSFCHMEGDPYDPKQPQELSTEELRMFLSIAVRAGVRKFKFLGGEPLIRKDIPLLVKHLRDAAPTSDISIITSGVGDENQLHALFDAGLDRANLSIHGWGLSRFLEHGRSSAQYQKRKRVLDILFAYGRPLKLNYVYTGSGVEEDLREFLSWSCGKPIVVNLLDDLKNPLFSSHTIEAVLVAMRGPWSQRLFDSDPNSLVTEHLIWDDGLRVEVKTQRLGEVAPWKCCRSCVVRSGCREGIHALRLTHQGVLQPCMDRLDLGLPLRPLFHLGDRKSVV